MTPKQKQEADARLRAKQKAASQPQSALAESAPQLYRAPQVNVPADMHEAARLIQGELEKIATAQSALLGMLEGISNGSVITINKAIAVNPTNGGKVEISSGSDQTYIDLTAPNEEGLDYGARLTRNGGVNGWVRLFTANGTEIKLLNNDLLTFTEASQYWSNGSVTPLISNKVKDVRHHQAMIGYTLSDGGAGQGGINWGGSADYFPPNATIFAYSSTAGLLGINGVLTSFGGIDGGYQQQQFSSYSAYVAGVNYTRVRNGDTGWWAAWRAGHAHYQGSTATMDWNNVGYFNDPLSVRANGYMEVRQYDDGNGIGNGSPGGGYGTALMWNGGAFSTQMAVNDTTGSISIRTSYVGQPKAWHRHEPNTTTKRQIYAELLAAGILSPAQHIHLLEMVQHKDDYPEPVEPRPELLEVTNYT